MPSKVQEQANMPRKASDKRNILAMPSFLSERLFIFHPFGVEDRQENSKHANQHHKGCEDWLS
jgi:hypothetical protein